jgi:DNA polymerase theta
MAHMSEDRQLCQLLSRNDRDVFKSIAATWKRKHIDDVTEKERNEAKQICYGMLYGIGVKGKIMALYETKRTTK